MPAFIFSIYANARSFILDSDLNITYLYLVFCAHQTHLNFLSTRKRIAIINRSTYIKIQIFCESHNLKKISHYCFVDPIFVFGHFWSLLAMKLQKYENIM